MVKHPNGRITPEAIEEIRKRSRNHESTRRVAKAVGVSQHTVRRYTRDIPRTQKFNKRLSAQAIEEIREKAKNEFSKHEISEISGLSYATVCRHTRGIRSRKCEYLGLETEKFLLTIMKEGYFIAEKGKMGRATRFYLKLIKKGFKIKHVCVHKKLAIYFPEGRDKHALKAFLTAGEKRFGKRMIRYWLYSGVLKRFEIPKNDYKRVRIECGY